MLLDHGEGLQVEFKTCQTRLSRDVYESVCAFLNRSGGELLLGVRDDGEVVGIDPERIELNLYRLEAGRFVSRLKARP